MLALHEAALAGAPASEKTWLLALDYWLTEQREDGSWGYYRGMDGTGTMTCAGAACVSAAARHVKDKAKVEAAQAAVKRAEKWLAEHFTVEANPPTRNTANVKLWHFSYLCDLERAARLAGWSKIGEHDWRQEGAGMLLKTQNGADGSWRGTGFAETDTVIATSLALLFLRSEPPPPSGKADAEKNETNVEGIAVDSEGKPLAGVEVRSGTRALKKTTVSGPDGRFRLAIDTNLFGTPRLLGESQDHSLVGFSDRRTPPMSRAEARAKRNEPVRIVLKPARTVRVNVATSDGKPAAGVTIQAAVDRMINFVDSETGQDGQAALRIPRDADIQWVAARKDDLGFDYYENYRTSPFERLPRLPETIDLRLHKPSHVHIRTIDLGNQPVAGVSVSPQSVRLHGKISSIPIARFPAVSQTSDAGGACDFAWLPADATEPITFHASIAPVAVVGGIMRLGYTIENQPQWNPEQPNIPVTFHLLKNAEVSGTVHFHDGKPAAGISVQITSGGPGTIVNKTDADGRYRLPAEPRKSNIVAVSDPNWAAASHTGVRLDNGQTRDHLDFVLTHGTRIHGRITLGTGRGMVTLIELGDRPAEGAANSSPGEGYRALWANVDEKGNFEFRVGPGRYILRMFGSKPGEGEVEIKVTDQPELVYDDTAIWPRKMRIDGRVVRAADGKAVAGAIVYGDPAGSLGSQEVRADAQGRFSILRASDAERSALYARAPDADLAGTATIASSASEATLELRPAATVVGFVYNSQGKPVAGEKVTAAFYAGAAAHTGYGNHSVNAVSDRSGRCRFPCLAVGSRCVIIILGVSTSIAQIDVKLDRPGEISVHDIVLPAEGPAPTPDAGQFHAVKPLPRATFSETGKSPDADLSFTSTILDDATGKPIPDAAVAVRVTRSRKELEVLEQTRHTTDAAGHFTFTIRKEHLSVAENEPNRETFVALDVTHPGYVAGTWWGYSLSKIIENMNKDKNPSFEKLRLRPGRPLTGVVAAPDGKPLADVPIEWDTYPSGPHETQSDKTGRFQVTVPAGGDISLLIMPREYAPMQLIAGPKQTDVGVLTMKKGVFLSGTVLDADGKPVADQWVCAQTFLDRVARNSVSQLSRPLDRYTRSDAAGKVAFDPLPPGEYLVGPSEGDRWRPGGAHLTTPVHGVYYLLKIKIDADGAKPFELKAQPTVKVAAQYYGSDGKKTGGPEFECVGRNLDDIGFSWQKSATAVGSDGRYEVLVPLGMKQAGIMFMSQEKISVRFRRSADAPLQAGPELHLGTLTGDMTDIRLIRYNSPVLLINARDRSGKPIAGAEVSGRYDDESLHLSPDFEKQNDDRFRSSSLLPDEKFTVTVTADDYRPQSRALSLAEGTTSQLDLVLVPR